jgi:site-specific recombinase XerD
MAKSKSDLVFTREDRISPISAFTLIQQQERIRNLLNRPWDACVHSARHTALTNLGLTGVDAFTLQRAAGHASITTTRKYGNVCRSLRGCPSDADDDEGRVPEKGPK